MGKTEDVFIGAALPSALSESGAHFKIGTPTRQVAAAYLVAFASVMPRSVRTFGFASSIASRL